MNPSRQRGPARAWLVFAASSLVFASCRAATLPPAPAALTTGVTIYSDINYDGDSAHVTSDIPDLRGLASGCAELDTQDDARFTVGSHTWTNCISSIGVARGWRVILFANPGFSGPRIELTESVRDMRRVPGPCLGTLNDCVSSIQVARTTGAE
jgi:hypothetical protein